MKLKNKFTLLMILPVLVGCGNNPAPQSGVPEPTPEPEEETGIVVNSYSMLAKKDLRFVFPYDDSFFSYDSGFYSQDLAIFSLGSCFMNYTYRSGVEYLTEAGFSDITPIGYDSETYKHNIAYVLGHKVIEDTDVVMLSIRATSGNEWEDNFNVGASGNHAGFDDAALGVLDSLEEYMDGYDSDTTKLLVTGYSRGGGVANVLASYLMTIDTKIVDSSNLYVYTFEAPRGLTKDMGVYYDNVFNIVNSADVVTHVVPGTYDLHRCGQDIDIFRSDVHVLMRRFDRNIEIPSFTKNSYFPNEAAYINYLLNRLTAEFEVEEGEISYCIHTREQFVEKLQPTIIYFLHALDSLSSSTYNQMFEGLNVLDFIGLLDSKTKLKEFMKKYLDMDNIQYDEEELDHHCEVAIGFLNDEQLNMKGILRVVLLTFKDNTTRMIDMHMTEVTYVLLKELKIY